VTRLDPVLPLIAEQKQLWERHGELYEQAALVNRLTEPERGPLLAAEQNAKRAHDDLYERLLATAPTTLAGAIAQLEIAAEHDDPDMVKAALVGLRAIAADHGETQS
jgi:hypothetical protein